MIRRIIFSTLILSLGLIANAQLYIYGGYGTSFPRLDSLNYILDRYNETRNYLTHEIEPFKTLDGFSFTMGVGFVGLDVGLGYLNRTEKRYAEGTPGGVDFRRDLKMSMNAFEFHSGFSVNAGSGGFALGARVEIGKIKVQSRIAETAQIADAEWDMIFDELHGAAGIYARIYLGAAGLAIEPYFMWPLFSTNVSDVNEAINPNTWQSDPEYLDIKPRGFGISIMLGAFTQS